MAARKSQNRKSAAPVVPPAPVPAAGIAVPPDQAAATGPDAVVVTAGSDATAAAPDPAPPEPVEETADAEDAGRYPVLSPLRFDGRRYRPDDPDANEVVMPRDQATALQDIGVLGEELT